MAAITICSDFGAQKNKISCRFIWAQIRILLNLYLFLSFVALWHSLQSWDQLDAPEAPGSFLSALRLHSQPLQEGEVVKWISPTGQCSIFFGVSRLNDVMLKPDTGGHNSPVPTFGLSHMGNNALCLICPWDLTDQPQYPLQSAVAKADEGTDVIFPEWHCCEHSEKSAHPFYTLCAMYQTVFQVVTSISSEDFKDHCSTMPIGPSL